MELHKPIYGDPKHISAINKSIMDFHLSFVELHNLTSIMELNNWYLQLHNLSKEP